MTKNKTPTPVYLDPGMHPGLEVKGLIRYHIIIQVVNVFIFYQRHRRSRRFHIIIQVVNVHIFYQAPGVDKLLVSWWPRAIDGGPTSSKHKVKKLV